MKLDLPTVISALLLAKGRASQVPLTAEGPDDVDELERKWGYNVNPLFPFYLPPLMRTVPIANIIPRSGLSRASLPSAMSPTQNA